MLSVSRMEGQLLFSFVFLSLLFSTGNAGDPYAGKVTIQLINSGRDTIWPAVHTDKGVNVMPTGVKLDPEEIYDVEVPDSWSGLIWARIGCSGNPDSNFHCDVGDCGTQKLLCHNNLPKPPVSLLRFNLAPNGGTSYYQVDLRNGFNLPVTLSPFRATCNKIMFLRDLRQQCPYLLAVLGKDGRKIACKSPCYATHDPRHCCTGAFANPQSCQPNEYTQLVESVSPTVVSNPLDNTQFSCAGGTSFTVSFI